MSTSGTFIPNLVKIRLRGGPFWQSAEILHSYDFLNSFMTNDGLFWLSVMFDVS